MQLSSFVSNGVTLTWALSGGCAKCRPNAANRSNSIQKARKGTGAAVRFSAMLAHTVCLCLQASRFTLAIVPSNLAFSNQILSLLCRFVFWHFIKLAQAGAQRFDASTMFDSRHFGSLPTAFSIARTVSFKNISFVVLVQDSCLLACCASGYQNSHIELLRHDSSTLFLHFFSLLAQLSSFVSNGVALTIKISGAPKHSELKTARSRVRFILLLAREP